MDGSTRLASKLKSQKSLTRMSLGEINAVEMLMETRNEFLKWHKNEASA
jgi:hypothetical protein